MNKNKLLRLIFIFSVLCMILKVESFAVNQTTTPKLGEQKVVDINWSRTTEPTGAKVLPVASWNWSDVKDINYNKTSDVWDGGTIGNYYIKDSRRPWDIATWHTNRHYWNGTADVRRFHGEFSIPNGYNIFDDITISSVGNYSSLGLNNIIPINDNIYVFVYPKGEEIDDTNFLKYFAFWTGTASQEAAKAVNGGEPITFHGILGTEPHDYKEIVGSPIPKENLLSHTDGWYCDAVEDNIGRIMMNSPDATEFVIDLIVEDFAEDGGMDRLNITFTKVTKEEIPEEEIPEEELPETSIPEEELPEEQIPEANIPENEIEEVVENPKTGGHNILLYFYLVCIPTLLAYYLFKKRQHH